MARLLVALSFLVALAAPAQVTVGVLPNTLNSSDANLPTPQTDVSLENPATGAGTITNVTFGWNAGCLNVAKIKFFRRSGNTLTMIAERGPFSTSGGRTVHEVTLSPGVPVQAGDLIGITRVASCGNALAEAGTGTQGYVALEGDATTGTISAGNTHHDKLALLGVAQAPAIDVIGYFPVVGSTAGSLGSNFKTSMQLLNPSASAVLGGRLVFHRAGTIGAASDPSINFSLAPGEVVSYADVVATLGQSGLGSIDLVMAPGSLTPVIATRIYNDAGAAGTAGFFEDLVGTASGVGTRILTGGTQGFLHTAVEPARTRINFGVRSLSSGAALTVRLENSAGIVLTQAQKAYEANFFEQVDSGTFLNGVQPGPNQKVRIVVTAGSAIVYAAITDNVTNDPSVQFATAVPQN
jgi:hypothetical protein